MKKNIISGIIGGVIVLLIVALFFVGRYYVIKNRIEQQPDTVQGVPTLQEDNPHIITQSNNFQSVVKAASVRTQRYVNTGMEFYYKMVFKDIYEGELDNQKIQFGKIGFEYGDGSVAEEMFYFVRTGDQLYGSRGYGMEFYPFEQTDWKYVPKVITGYNMVPLELTINSYDVNLANQADFQRQEFLSQFVIKVDPEGIPVGVKAVSVLNSRESSGPFTKLPDYAQIIEPQNKLTKDPSKNEQIIAGRPTGSKTGIVNQVFTVTYPEKVNGMDVYLEPYESNSQTFRIEDQYQSYATLECSQYRSPELGPKEGEPTFIAESSRGQLVDWGIKAQRGYYSVSFTTKNEHCYFNTGGILRPGMFKIAFPKM